MLEDLVSPCLSLLCLWFALSWCAGLWACLYYWQVLMHKLTAGTCTVRHAGISQLMFIIKPCAQLAPHHHPRADELLTLIQGVPCTNSVPVRVSGAAGVSLIFKQIRSQIFTAGGRASQRVWGRQGTGWAPGACGGNNVEWARLVSVWVCTDFGDTDRRKWAWWRR